jgi:predicted metal-dependent hydrolase
MKIDQIIRSRRRTFSLEIRPDGRLVVRAPYVATDAQIQKLVDQKADWIKKNRAKVKRRFSEVKPKTFSPGELFWYLGEQYPLKLTYRQRPPLDLDGAFLLSMSAQTNAKETFIAWYRRETRRITRDLIDKYIAQYRFKVNAVHITSARTRWGSCTGQKNLNFTYRLSMAPMNVIEYVVVHELAHLKVRNHGHDFWRHVANLKPNYQKDRAWLKEYGALLTLE